MRSFKKREFESTLFGMIQENNIHTVGEVVRYDNDGDTSIATVGNHIIDKLSPEQIAELKSIK